MALEVYLIKVHHTRGGADCCCAHVSLDNNDICSKLKEERTPSNSKGISYFCKCFSKLFMASYLASATLRCPLWPCKSGCGCHQPIMGLTKVK